MLKNHGCLLEHNYGHGQQHLSTVLVVLILLAFLWHIVLHLADEMDRQLGKAVDACRAVLEHFESWQHLLVFMLWGQIPRLPDSYIRNCW